MRDGSARHRHRQPANIVDPTYTTQVEVGRRRYRSHQVGLDLNLVEILQVRFDGQVIPSLPVGHGGRRCEWRERGLLGRKR